MYIEYPPKTNEFGSIPIYIHEINETMNVHGVMVSIGGFEFNDYIQCSDMKILEYLRICSSDYITHDPYIQVLNRIDLQLILIRSIQEYNYLHRYSNTLYSKIIALLILCDTFDTFYNYGNEVHNFVISNYDSILTTMLPCEYIINSYGIVLDVTGHEDFNYIFNNLWIIGVDDIKYPKCFSKYSGHCD